MIERTSQQMWLIQDQMTSLVLLNSKTDLLEIVE